MDSFVQVMILLLGAAAIALLASKDAWLRQWGYLLGFISEPFWIYSALRADQWAIIALALWWAGFYFLGARNNWVGWRRPVGWRESLKYALLNPDWKVCVREGYKPLRALEDAMLKRWQDRCKSDSTT